MRKTKILRSGLVFAITVALAALTTLGVAIAQPAARASTATTAPAPGKQISALKAKVFAQQRVIAGLRTELKYESQRAKSLRDQRDDARAEHADLANKNADLASKNSTMRLLHSGGIARTN